MADRYKLTSVFTQSGEGIRGVEIVTKWNISTPVKQGEVVLILPQDLIGRLAALIEYAK